MANALLTLNAGSSSIKFSAFTADEAGIELAASGQVEGLGATPIFSVEPRGKAKSERRLGDGRADHHLAVGAILDWLADAGLDRSVVAVGHRVVHGGVDFITPIAVDDGVLTRLKALIPLAPLHQPHNIAGIEAARAHFPRAMQVACFDTAFHRSHPFIADTFALPRRFYEEGIRRYGFHGLSYEYIARRLRVRAPRLAAGRVIVAHLGNGASMCAMRDGKSVASTMGFTALDGLPMGTRCGQLDPGVVLYLMAEKRMSAEAISDLLYKESGLKGLSGISQDMRELEAADSDAARDAIDYFVSRIRRELGGLAAAIAGLDALVFTGGIGENASQIRAAVLRDMAWIGIDLDQVANAAGQEIISQRASRVTVFVIKTDEERMIAEHSAEAAGIAGRTREAKVLGAQSPIEASPALTASDDDAFQGPR
jgi:acetate kinase